MNDSPMPGMWTLTGPYPPFMPLPPTDRQTDRQTDRLDDVPSLARLAPAPLTGGAQLWVGVVVVPAVVALVLDVAVRVAGAVGGRVRPAAAVQQPAEQAQLVGPSGAAHPLGAGRLRNCAANGPSCSQRPASGQGRLGHLHQWRCAYFT